jgi:SAM-dependent methyltransferase
LNPLRLRWFRFGNRDGKIRVKQVPLATRWQEYFERSYGSHSGILETAVTHWTYNSPLYHHLLRLAPPGARLLDVGCGYGFSDIYLAACGRKVTGIDYDAGVVERAVETGSFFQSTATFELGDAFDLAKHHDSFDLAYSVGVVEHFDRDVTVRLIAEQAKCAPLVATLIPTKYIKYSEGLSDERLYSPRGLAAMVRDAGLQVVGSFGYGDIAVGWHNWVKRLLTYGAFRLLQNRFGYAMGIVCIGRRP